MLADTVALSYDHESRPISQAVNGETPPVFRYDLDGRLAGSGIDCTAPGTSKSALRDWCQLGRSPLTLVVRCLRFVIATSSREVLRRSLESGQTSVHSLHGAPRRRRIEPPLGSTGDSYDNALAEGVIAHFKAEVIRRMGPWKELDDLECATLNWVSWFNHGRLLEPLEYIPPVEYQQVFHYRRAAQSEVA